MLLLDVCGRHAEATHYEESRKPQTRAAAGVARPAPASVCEGGESIAPQPISAAERLTTAASDKARRAVEGSEGRVAACSSGPQHALAEPPRSPEGPLAPPLTGAAASPQPLRPLTCGAHGPRGAGGRLASRVVAPKAQRFSIATVLAPSNSGSSSLIADMRRFFGQSASCQLATTCCLQLRDSLHDHCATVCRRRLQDNDANQRYEGDV